MAVKLGSGEGDDLTEMADINVTPFIDVALVLLIIFIMAAPLSIVDVPVDLLVSNTAPAPRLQDPVFLTVEHDLSLRRGEGTVARVRLKSQVAEPIVVASCASHRPTEPKHD